MERPRHAHAFLIARREARQPVVVGQMSVNDVEAMVIEESLDRFQTAEERPRVLRPGDDGVREADPCQLCLELVAADVRVVRVDARVAQRRRLRERRRRRAGPAIGRGEVEDLHRGVMLHFAPPWRSTPSFWRSWPARSASRK